MNKKWLFSGSEPAFSVDYITTDAAAGIVWCSYAVEFISPVYNITAEAPTTVGYCGHGRVDGTAAVAYNQTVVPGNVSLKTIIGGKTNMVASFPEASQEG